MNHKQKACGRTLVLALSMFAGARRSQATELITNGSFETGDLSGWMVANKHAGTFSSAVVGADSPISGSPTSPNPMGGTYDALSDQDSDIGGANVLYQPFTVDAGMQKATLSFDMFVTDWAGFGPIVDPSGWTQQPEVLPSLKTTSLPASTF